MLLILYMIAVSLSFGSCGATYSMNFWDEIDRPSSGTVYYWLQILTGISSIFLFFWGFFVFNWILVLCTTLVLGTITGNVLQKLAKGWVLGPGLLLLAGFTGVCSTVTVVFMHY